MQKFGTHLRHMPKAVREITLGILLLVVTVVGAVVIGRILDHVQLIVAFDTFFYTLINLGPHPAWLDAIISPFNFNFLPWGGTFIPSFLYFVFAFSLIYIGIRHRRELLWTIVTLLVAVLVDTILFKITNVYVVRDRPFLHLANNLTDQMKAIWIHWPTYPSGHVRDMALYSTVIAGYARELLLPFVIFTLWIAFTRIYIGAHYPTDVFAGWGIGVLAGIAVLLLIKPLRAHFLYEREQKKLNKLV